MIVHQVGFATVIGIAIAVGETSVARTDSTLSCDAYRSVIVSTTGNPAPAAVIGVALSADADAARAKRLARATSSNRARAAHAVVSTCAIRIAGASRGAGGGAVTNERAARRRAAGTRGIIRTSAHAAGQRTALTRAGTVRIATNSLAANSAGALGTCAAGLPIARATRLARAGNTRLTGLAREAARAAVVVVVLEVDLATVEGIAIAVTEASQANYGTDAAVAGRGTVRFRRTD